MWKGSWRVFALLSQPSGRLLAAPLDKPVRETATEVTNGEVGKLAIVTGEFQIGVFGAGVAGPHIICEVVAQELLEEIVHLLWGQ
jgi:hypothetical protein